MQIGHTETGFISEGRARRLAKIIVKEYADLASYEVTVSPADAFLLASALEELGYSATWNEIKGWLKISNPGASVASRTSRKQASGVDLL